jgi:hypothetical protein
MPKRPPKSFCKRRPLVPIDGCIVIDGGIVIVGGIVMLGGIVTVGVIVMLGGIVTGGIVMGGIVTGGCVRITNIPSSSIVPKEDLVSSTSTSVTTRLKGSPISSYSELITNINIPAASSINGANASKISSGSSEKGTKSSLRTYTI